jgi:hypothetical protein
MGHSYVGGADPMRGRQHSSPQLESPMTDKLRRAWAHAVRLAPFAMFALAMFVEPNMRRW